MLSLIWFFERLNFKILGATVKETKRGGTSLAQYIRHDANKAVIRLSLANKGDNAYKPETFG